MLCPFCGAALPPVLTGQVECRCPICQWTGNVQIFRPVTPRLERAQPALPDDAVCAHHPTKRATTVCAGTGDFICPLCAVDLGGKTYSAQYLSQHAREPVAKSFDRFLPRMDRVAVTALVLPLMCCTFLEIAGIPLAITCYFMHLRQRREDPLLQRLVSRTRLILLGVLVLGLPVLLFGFTVALVVRLVWDLRHSTF